MKRAYRLIFDPKSGLTFRFTYETGTGGPLHIEARHGVAPQEAIMAFRDGTTTWDAAHKRFETRTATHTLYWAWHASGSVLVITSFRNGGP